MAINISTNLLSVNPASNDSIIKYQSTNSGYTRSDIVIGEEIFTVYPYDNQFAYNFKDVVNSLINANGFCDTILPDLSAGDFIYDDENLQLTITPTISTYNNIAGETISTSYTFIRSVEQLGGYNRRLNNYSDVRLLLPSENSFDYNLTYYEGYPFDFSIQGITSGSTYYFRNTNSGIVSDVYTASTSDVKRIFLSDGAYNETLTGVLPMSSNVNKIELHVNGIIKANILIRRKESRCGVYLKWFNDSGSNSYWLFDNVQKDSLKTKDLEQIAGAWDNLQNVTSVSESLGKTASLTTSLSTSCDDLERPYLTSLLTSAKVELYVHTSPFNQVQAYDFYGIHLADGSFPWDNKTRMNKLKVNLEQQYNTVTY